MDGRMLDRQMDEGMDRRVDGWTDGWFLVSLLTDRKMKVNVTP